MESAVIPGKKVRDKLAGGVPQPVKQIQRGPGALVLWSCKRGRDRKANYYIRSNYVPEASALGQEISEVHPDTKEMLKLLDFRSRSHLQVYSWDEFQNTTWNHLNLLCNVLNKSEDS